MKPREAWYSDGGRVLLMAPGTGGRSRNERPMTDESEAAAELSARIVAAYVTDNSLPCSELVKLDRKLSHSGASASSPRPPRRNRSRPCRRFRSANPSPRPTSSAWRMGAGSAMLRRHLQIKYWLCSRRMPREVESSARLSDGRAGTGHAEARSASAKREGLRPDDRRRGEIWPSAGHSSRR